MLLTVFDEQSSQSSKARCCRSAPSARQKTATVLVAEDDADQRSQMELILLRAGYRVLNASTGDEALTHLSIASVDALVSDLNMDRNDGFELIRRIRAHPGFQAAYLLVTTGVMLDLCRLEQLNLKPENYLQKPFSLSELLARLRSGIQAPAPPRCVARAHTGFCGRHATISDELKPVFINP
jgi:CheY-like chemotaxis protein